MNVQGIIEDKIGGELSPRHIEVINESHMHSVPPNSQTHFKVIVVSDAFVGKRAVQRHQMVYRILAEELQTGVHALALHTYSPEEWQGAAPDSPNCLGGSKTTPT